MKASSFIVRPMSTGRFAVVEVVDGRDVETLAVLHSEDAALTAAAALNNGPVDSVAAAGRWERSAA